MKTFVRLAFLFLISSVALTGCVKTVDTYQNNYSIAGSWVLTNAAKGNAGGWAPLYTGFENGVFEFYANGSARYTDSYGTYQGIWYITTVSSGTYYDYYGNAYTDLHDSFEISLRDNYGNPLHLYFDDINFNSSNAFTTTYYKNHAVERYSFRRY